MSLYETMCTAILSGSPSPVGAIVGTRVHADELPDPATLPAVVVLLVAATDLDSDVQEMGSLTLALVQVDCWGRTRAQCDQLALAVKAALRSLAPDITFNARRDGRESQSVKEARRTILEFNVTTSAA